MFEVTVLIILKTRLNICAKSNASFQTQFIRFGVLPKIKRIDKTHMCRLKRGKKRDELLLIIGSTCQTLDL